MRSFVYPLSILGLYLSLISYRFDLVTKIEIAGFEEIYGTTTLIQGIIMGFYCNHIVTRWWELRNATGSVAGALVDIAMLLRAYIKCVKTNDMQSQLALLGDRLKHLHMLHLCEVFGVASSTYFSHPVLPIRPFKSDSHDLVSCLSTVLEEMTELVNQAPISDAVKFSALPALQQNISTIRSASGDCTMILNTKHPRSFIRFIAFFTLVHVVSFPIYLGLKTDWNPVSVALGATAFFSIFGGFILIVARDFANPFILNTFRLERIVSSNFQIIDDCLSKSR